MRKIKTGLMILVAVMAMAASVGLTGCADVGVGYDEGPEWDGGYDAYGVYDVGGGGYDRDHHFQAFHGDAGGRESDRGRASMGGRAVGGGGAGFGGGGGAHGGGGGGGHGGGGGGHR